MSDPLDTLTEKLQEFPGIGPRAARRLAFWLVRRPESAVRAFADALLAARKTVRTCSSCYRLFPAQADVHLCAICASDKRDRTTLLIVEKDVDLENIERTGTYSGTYFVLGGTATPLDKEPERKIRLRELIRSVTGRKSENPPLTEIIFALSATPDGEDTVLFLREQLAPLLTDGVVRTTMLGRGLSTGTELEYVDADTMRNALKGRG